MADGIQGHGEPVARGPDRARSQASPSPSQGATTPSEPVGKKLLIELSPLVLFFLVYARTDIFIATGVLMVATIVSLIAAKLVLGKITIMPLVTAGFVLVFGSLTLWFSNEVFIKLKPTIVYVCLATPLLGGLLFGKSLLSHVLGEAMTLDESGWRKLTLRWGLFFLFLAVLNEVVWRSFSTATWVSMKSFGFLPLTLAFAAAQVPLMIKHKPQPRVGNEDRSEA